MFRKLHSPTSHGVDGYCGVACLHFCPGYCGTISAPSVQSNRQSTSRMTSIFVCGGNIFRDWKRDHVQSRVTQPCDADAVFTPFGRHHGQLVSHAFRSGDIRTTYALRRAVLAFSHRHTDSFKPATMILSIFEISAIGFWYYVKTAGLQ